MSRRALFRYIYVITSGSREHIGTIVTSEGPGQIHRIELDLAGRCRPEHRNTNWYACVTNSTPRNVEVLAEMSEREEGWLGLFNEIRYGRSAFPATRYVFRITSSEGEIVGHAITRRGPKDIIDIAKNRGLENEKVCCGRDVRVDILWASIDLCDMDFITFL